MPLVTFLSGPFLFELTTSYLKRLRRAKFFYPPIFLFKQDKIYASPKKCKKAAEYVRMSEHFNPGIKCRLTSNLPIADIDFRRGPP